MEFELGILWLAFLSCLLCLGGTAKILIYKFIEDFIYNDVDETSTSPSTKKGKHSKKASRDKKRKKEWDTNRPVPNFIVTLGRLTTLLTHITTLFLSLSFLLLLYYFLSSEMTMDYVFLNSRDGDV